MTEEEHGAAVTTAMQSIVDITPRLPDGTVTPDQLMQTAGMVAAGALHSLLGDQAKDERAHGCAMLTISFNRWLAELQEDDEPNKMRLN